MEQVKNLYYIINHLGSSRVLSQDNLISEFLKLRDKNFYSIIVPLSRQKDADKALSLIKQFSKFESKNEKKDFFEVWQSYMKDDCHLQSIAGYISLLRDKKHSKIKYAEIILQTLYGCNYITSFNISWFICVTCENKEENFLKHNLFNTPSQFSISSNTEMFFNNMQ